MENETFVLADEIGTLTQKSGQTMPLPEVVTFAKGQPLFDLGDDVPHMYVVMEGRVEIRWQPLAGKSKKKFFADLPDIKPVSYAIVGAYPYFRRAISNQCYMATENVRAIKLNSELFLSLHAQGRAYKIVRDLVLNSELSSGLFKLLSGKYGVLPNVEALAKALLDKEDRFRFDAARLIYTLMKTRAAMSDDPSVIVTPPIA